MKLRSLAAALGAGVLVLSANTAFATDVPADPPADVTPAPGPTLVTVLGTGIKLSVVTDATGHLTSVDLTGSETTDPLTGAVATGVSPHAVRFVIADTGTTIEVKASGKSVKTEVETHALADLLGQHTWSGELFGVGGGATEITFAIGDDGGVPTISLVSVAGPGSGSEVVTPSVSSDDDESEAKLRIELSAGGHEARVTVKVEVEQDDGRTHAELKISARSDLFAVEDAVGPVADPQVNVPTVDEPREDDDHESDHDDDHESDHDDDHESDDDDHDRSEQQREHQDHERGERDDHESHDD